MAVFLESCADVKRHGARGLHGLRTRPRYPRVDGKFQERRHRIVTAGLKLAPAQRLQSAVDVRLVRNEVEPRLTAHSRPPCTRSLPARKLSLLWGGV
jgi:hypothetical protein